MPRRPRRAGRSPHPRPARPTDRVCDRWTEPRTRCSDAGTVSFRSGPLRNSLIGNVRILLISDGPVDHDVATSAKGHATATAVAVGPIRITSQRIGCSHEAQFAFRGGGGLPDPDRGRDPLRRGAAGSPGTRGHCWGPDCYRRKILLDLQDTPHIDSSGVSWLVHFHKTAARPAGCWSCIRCPRRSWPS